MKEQYGHRMEAGAQVQFRKIVPALPWNVLDASPLPRPGRLLELLLTHSSGEGMS